MWEEEKHPRDNDGRFAEKGGGGYSKRQIELARQRLAQGIKKREQPQSEQERETFINVQLFAQNYTDWKDNSMRKSIDTLSQRKQEHEDKIKHPEKYYPNWNEYSDKEKAGRLFYWQKEIERFKNEINAIKEEQNKRNGNK